MWQWNGSELIEVAQSTTQRRQRHTTARNMWQQCGSSATWQGGWVGMFVLTNTLKKFLRILEVVFRSGTCVLQFQRGFVSLQ